MSAGSKTAISAAGGSCSVSGIRSTMPSSAQTACASTPYRCCNRVSMASAQGACTAPPNGVCRQTRQSPSSSRNRSTTIVRSSGTCPVACRCSVRYASTLSQAQRSSPPSVRRARAVVSSSRPNSRTNAPIACPSSAGRDGVSPRQNGNRPGCPGAGETTTRSCVMSSIRQVLVPRVNTSPTRDSYTISSSSSPTRDGGPSVPEPTRYTPNRPRSGMVPPLVTASRCAPGLGVRTPVTRSQTSRGRSSANSSEG